MQVVVRRKTQQIVFSVISENNGTRLLRPISAQQAAVDKVLDEVFAVAKSTTQTIAGSVVDEAPAKPNVSQPEPATITHARRETESNSTRQCSCPHDKPRRSTDWYAYRYDSVPGHDSWKRHRTAQYRSRDKRHESDPNPVHVDL